MPLVYLFANAFEWWIHGNALHRRNPLAPVLYDQHTPRHHMLYLTEDMAMRDPREYRLVLIPGYGLLLIFLGQIPITLGSSGSACRTSRASTPPPRSATPSATSGCTSRITCRMNTPLPVTR